MLINNFADPQKQTFCFFFKIFFALKLSTAGENQYTYQLHTRDQCSRNYAVKLHNSAGALSYLALRQMFSQKELVS